MYDETDFCGTTPLRDIADTEVVQSMNSRQPLMEVHTIQTTYTYPEPPTLDARLHNSVILSASSNDPSQGNSVAITKRSSSCSPKSSTPELIFEASSPLSNFVQTPGAQSTLDDGVDAVCEDPGQVFELIGTYAARRRAAGRKEFPWECGVCSKRYLYHDSAQKHYRQKHGEPINIIQRYDAPKRPLAGHRNYKVAATQLQSSKNSSLSPTISYSESHSYRALGKSASAVNHPLLIHLIDNEAVKVEFAGQAAILPTTTNSGHAAFNIIHRQPLHDSKSKLKTTQPLVSSKSEVPCGGQDENVYHAQSGFINPVLRKPSEIELIQPSSRLRKTQVEFLKGMQLRPHAVSHFANSNVAETARQALCYMENENNTTSAEMIEEPSSDRQLPSLNCQEVAESQKPTSDTAATLLPRNVAYNIAKLRAQVNNGEIPSLMPAVYDETDKTLTWHSQFGQFFRRIDGVWERWDESQCCWIGRKASNSSNDVV